MASGILRRKMCLLHTSQTVLFNEYARNTSSDSDFLNKTVLTPEAAKQSNSRLAKAEIAEKLEVKNANRVVESPNRFSDFVANIPATLKNVTRLALYRLWHARMEHVNSNRLGSLSQHVTALEQINLPFLEHLNFAKCNFSNMTQIVNEVTPRRILQQLKKDHMDIWGPYRVLSIGGNACFLFLIDDLTRKSWFFCKKSRK